MDGWGERSWGAEPRPAPAPCALSHRRAWGALLAAGRARRGQGTPSAPCAGRGPSVYPTALACVASVVTCRARDGVASASSPWWTSALPCCRSVETRRARWCAVAVLAWGVAEARVHPSQDSAQGTRRAGHTAGSAAQGDGDARRPGAAPAATALSPPSFGEGDTGPARDRSVAYAATAAWPC